MAFEWQMVDEEIEATEKIEKLLRQGFEPFAFSDERQTMWFKRMVNVERDPKATDEGLTDADFPDREAEVEDVDS
jgi:hypothetical protein